MPNVSNIKYLDRITDIFGEFPSFHGAEVVRMVLDRGNFREGIPTTLVASIHVWKMTNQTVDRRYILENHTLVTFRFDDIRELEINHFNHQNVLGAMTIKDFWHESFQVLFDGNHGVKAQFKCERITVLEAVPYES